jgi:dynein regulatory complex protein 1
VIDDQSYRVWNAVYVAMEKYNKLLTERYTLTQDISSVKQQNDELKGLLKHYMAAKINEELQVPPTQVMLAQAGMLTRGGHL